MFNFDALKPLLRPLYVPIASWYYDKFKAPKRYQHLNGTVRELKARKILEIGVWNGKRALEMIQEAQKYHNDVEYFGFDLFEDLTSEGYNTEVSKHPPTESEVQTLLTRSGARINLFKGNTLESLPEAVQSLPQMDFIFIDGGHSLETIASDWKYVQQLMHSETVVIFDDYWRNRDNAGCKITIDAIDRKQFNVSVLPEVDIFENPDFGRLEISFAKVTKK